MSNPRYDYASPEASVEWLWEDDPAWAAQAESDPLNALWVRSHRVTWTSTPTFPVGAEMFINSAIANFDRYELVLGAKKSHHLLHLFGALVRYVVRPDGSIRLAIIQVTPDGTDVVVLEVEAWDQDAAERLLGFYQKSKEQYGDRLLLPTQA